MPSRTPPSRGAPARGRTSLNCPSDSCAICRSCALPASSPNAIVLTVTRLPRAFSWRISWMLSGGISPSERKKITSGRWSSENTERNAGIGCVPPDGPTSLSQAFSFCIVLERTRSHRSLNAHGSELS